jgi:uncharacterized damage-inducible protein DinB
MDVRSVGPFLEYWEKMRARTLRVAAVVPADRLEWRWKPGTYSPGDILRHLAGVERWMWAENARRRPSLYPGHGEDLAGGLDAVRAYLGRCHAEAMEMFRGLSDADLAERCETPGGAAIRVGKWLRLMVKHEIHHRGQLYLLLAMMGVATPPLYGLTEEEVRAASRPLSQTTSEEKP